MLLISVTAVGLSSIYTHMYVCVYIFFSSCKCKTVDGNKLLLRNATERMERMEKSKVISSPESIKLLNLKK